MAKPARSALDGISFENRKLEEVIKEQEEKDRITAIELERRRDQNRGAHFTGIPWGRKIKTTYRGRSSKARRWDAHKIRREYGLMKKKFESQWENCLWMVAFKAPITAREILKTIGGSQGGVTGAMSYIYQFLGDGNDYGTILVKREDHGGGKPKTYAPSEDLVTDEARTLWFEKAREHYMTARTIYNRARRDEKREANKKIKDQDESKIAPPVEEVAEDQEQETQIPETKEIATSAFEGLEEELGAEKIKHEQREKEAKKRAIADEDMSRDEQAEALERVIGEFVVAKLKAMDLLKTAELKLTVSGGVKIKIQIGFGR